MNANGVTQTSGTWKVAVKMSKAKKMRFVQKAAIAVLAVYGAASLASCAARPDESLKTASIENDYRARHPITLAEVEHSLNIPIGTGDRNLSSGLKDTIRGFAQEYAEKSSGSVQLAIPAGTVNAGAARAMSGNIRSVLVGAGIKSNRIIMTTYAPESADVSAPVRLSYIAVSAITDECGKWPEDLMNNSMMNKNWHNFGCATQNNMAAMIANPMDLKAPRATTPIDAERRSTVIGLYREGSSTVSE